MLNPKKSVSYSRRSEQLNSLPLANELSADQGHDAAWRRDISPKKGITPCIPPKKNLKAPLGYDKELYKRRRKIEIILDRLKDWRRIAVRYEQCAHTFFSAICVALPIIFHLN